MKVFFSVWYDFNANENSNAATAPAVQCRLLSFIHENSTCRKRKSWALVSPVPMNCGLHRYQGFFCYQVCVATSVVLFSNHRPWCIGLCCNICYFVLQSQTMMYRFVLRHLLFCSPIRDHDVSQGTEYTLKKSIYRESKYASKGQT